MKKSFIQTCFILGCTVAMFGCLSNKNIDNSLYSDNVSYLYGMNTPKINNLKRGQSKDEILSVLKQQGWYVHKVKSLQTTKSDKKGSLEYIIVVSDFPYERALHSSECQAVYLEVEKTGLTAVNPFMCQMLDRLDNLDKK